MADDADSLFFEKVHIRETRLAPGCIGITYEDNVSLRTGRLVYASYFMLYSIKRTKAMISTNKI